MRVADGTALSDVLLSLPLFEGVEADTLERLNIRPSARTIERGRTLFDRYDTSSDVHFIVSGLVICVAWTEEGRELAFSDVGPGGYIGELAAIGEGPRSLAAYAQRPSRIVSLSRIDFQSLINTVPKVNARIIRDLVAVVRQLTLRLEQMNSQSVDIRVRGYIINLLLKYEVDTVDTWTAIPTHADIANTLGVNRESVTRSFSKLNQAGIIESGRQRVRILQPEKLRAGLVGDGGRF